MSLSVQKLSGAFTSLGFVQVGNNGTPVALSVNIDANNSNAPGTAFPPPAAGLGNQTLYSPRFKSFHVQGYKPGANNSGMVQNANNVYLLMAPAGGGSGNRTDSGAMIAVIAPGADFFFPPSTGFVGTEYFSPYTLYLDADTNGDGALVAAYGAAQG